MGTRWSKHTSSKTCGHLDKYRENGEESTEEEALTKGRLGATGLGTESAVERAQDKKKDWFYEHAIPTSPKELAYFPFRKFSFCRLKFEKYYYL